MSLIKAFAAALSEQKYRAFTVSTCVIDRPIANKDGRNSILIQISKQFQLGFFG
jgi:hypothetical protein